MLLVSTIVPVQPLKMICATGLGHFRRADIAVLTRAGLEARGGRGREEAPKLRSGNQAEPNSLERDDIRHREVPFIVASKC